MSFTSHIFYFIIVICIAIRKGNGASIEVLPGETVPPNTPTLTLKCTAASGSDITDIFAIYLYKDDQPMASIVGGNPPQLHTGFDSMKYTASRNLPNTEPLNFLQVDIANPDCGDGNEYKCKLSASNGGGPISPNPEDIKSITVETSPSDLTFSVNPDKIIYFEDDEVTITCIGKVGDPVQPWLWERKLSGALDWESYPDSSDITNGALVPPSAGECSFSRESVLTKVLKSPEDGMSLRCLMDGVVVGLKDFTVYYGPSLVTLTPPSVDPVFEGDDISAVTCNHGTCNPYCVLEWYKDNNLVPTNDGVLELTNVERSQAGTYICRVSNPTIPDSEMTASLSVDVHYGPNSVHLTPPTIDPIIEGNAMTPVTCSPVDCNPYCEQGWYNENNLVPTNNGVLELTNVDRSQAGTYIYGPKSVDLTPTIIDPILEGYDMAPVTCSHDDCNPPCELEWFKDNTLITNDAVLELMNVNRSEAGTYICKVFNSAIPGSEIEQNFAVEVYYGPDFIHINSSKTVGLIEFEDVAPIPCWTHCNPKCDIKWYNGSIDDGNLISGVNGELELFNVSRSQQAIFYCEVSHPFNSDGRLNDSIDLQVYYGPELVQIKPDNIDSVAEGTSLQVTCSANCNPVCQFTWYFQSQESGYIKPATGGVLNLPNIYRNEAGLYICEVNQAEIVNSSKTVEIEIHVHCPSSEVHITTEPSKEEYEVDESVSFTCSGEFSSGTNPSWKWQKSSANGQEWADYVNFTVSDPSDDGCSYRQDTTISITINADDDGSDIRCIKDENEDLSISLTLKVKSNDKNGGCENYAKFIILVCSLLALFRLKFLNHDAFMVFTGSVIRESYALTTPHNTNSTLVMSRNGEDMSVHGTEDGANNGSNGQNNGENLEEHDSINMQTNTVENTETNVQSISNPKEKFLVDSLNLRRKLLVNDTSSKMKELQYNMVTSSDYNPIMDSYKSWLNILEEYQIVHNEYQDVLDDSEREVYYLVNIKNLNQR
ncbi:hypothetical protein LOTGIDRAFT_158062 [Lottia gigantea]|uniref:Ig-like domain-containing protein n=1 Tax=Lottia gigantea TaxID=225164 RepID=V4CDD7_LOTGI|nr:hypothetical protein LOTGIDRAFT_158062 [Lottia gigantea]ESO99904.1 hypothetical protein LOTGIDRAFT_158062 [Lottia gigantea]